LHDVRRAALVPPNASTNANNIASFFFIKYLLIMVYLNVTAKAL